MAVDSEYNQNLIDKYNFNSNLDTYKITIFSTQLGLNYDLWSNNDNIENILDMQKNTFCLMMKIVYPNLDDKTIKCIVMAMYIYMYCEISNI